MAAPRFLLSPSDEEGAAPWDPRDDRAPMSSSSSLECVSLEDQGQDIGAFGSINPHPQGMGTFGWGDSGHPGFGLTTWGSQPFRGTWGRTISSVPCPGFPGPPSPQPTALKLVEGGGSWGASGCSRCFQLTFQNGLSLAAGGQAGRGGEACGTLGRRAHPSCKALPGSGLCKAPAALPLCVSKAEGLEFSGGEVELGPLLRTCHCERKEPTSTLTLPALTVVGGEGQGPEARCGPVTDLDPALAPLSHL